MEKKQTENGKNCENSELNVPAKETTCVPKKPINIEKYLYRPGVIDLSSDSDSSSSVSSLSFSSESSSSDDEYQENERKNKQKFTTKTKGELGFEDLPPIEQLRITVPEKDLVEVGFVSSIVDYQVVIKSKENIRPLNLNSVLFLSHLKPLGNIFDVFGPVPHPYYTVRFNSVKDIEDIEVKVGTKIYYAPDHEDITSFVLMEELKNEKGSDASWYNNNEPPVECLDYSDDEKEKLAKNRRKRNVQKKTIVGNPDISKTSNGRGSQSVCPVDNRRFSSPVPLHQNYFTRSVRPVHSSVSRLPFPQWRRMTSIQPSHSKQETSGSNNIFTFANPGYNANRLNSPGLPEDQQFSVFSFNAFSPRQLSSPLKSSFNGHSQPAAALNGSQLFPQPRAAINEHSRLFPQPNQAMNARSQLFLQPADKNGHLQLFPQPAASVNRQSQLFPQQATSVNRQPQLFSQPATSVNRQPQLFSQPATSVNRQSQLFPQPATSVNSQSQLFPQPATSLNRQSQFFSQPNIHADSQLVQEPFCNRSTQARSFESSRSGFLPDVTSPPPPLFACNNIGNSYSTPLTVDTTYPPPAMSPMASPMISPWASRMLSPWATPKTSAVPSTFNALWSSQFPSMPALYTPTDISSNF